MKNSILKALSNNLGYKILALSFAFVLWLMVYNTEDPTRTETMTINVSVINKESVEKLNKYFEVSDGAGRITFSITAPRSVQEKLDEGDFTAVADMEYLTIDEGGTTGTVPIELKCTNNNLSESVKVTTTTKTLHVKLETLMSKQFVISANTVGKVASGHALGAVTITAPNVLKVSGPESVVSKVSAVVATIDVDDMSVNVTDTVVPVLYDSEGKEIDATRLTLSNTTVNISANILKVKEVPITVKPSGDPAENYVITSILSNPTTIQLKGSATVLNSISAIEIPSELVNVEDATSDVYATIDISDYIPYGAELVDKADATVDITVMIGRIRDRVFSVATENIVVIGLPTDTEVRFVHSSIAVTISGLEEDINILSGSILSGSIDVTDLPEGTHTLSLSLDIDGTKYTYNDVKVSVIIGEDNTDPETEEPGSETNESEA
ncbi:MAG: YbbR-like domain-containing protein [Agathobacter sp.]